jgi:hypothetical protein
MRQAPITMKTVKTSGNSQTFLRGKTTLQYLTAMERLTGPPGT